MPNVSSFFMNNRISNAGRGAWKTMNKTAAGRGFIRGVKENLGWVYEGEKDLGFIGRKGPGFFAEARTAWKEGGGKLGGSIGVAGKVASRYGGILMAAWAFYEGMKEGGITGGIKSSGRQTVSWGAIRMADAVLGGVAGTALMAGEALAYGGYRFGRAAQKYGRGLRNISMAIPVVDPFGTAATMRQRSLSALQNTHINGRIVLGQEAILMSSLHM
jgi:hypothetical protein